MADADCCICVPRERVRYEKLWVLILVLALGTGLATAQDTEITLEPITDSAFGLSGVVPAGWKSLGNGLLQRANTAEDVTLFGMQSAPFKADVLLDAVLPQLDYQKRQKVWELLKPKP